MAAIKIQIVNTQLQDMGIEAGTEYTLFKFPDRLFGGYWVNSLDSEITFYVGDNSYICENNKYNKDILDALCE